MTNSEIIKNLSNWREIAAKYQGADNWKSIWQICNTIIPFLGIWVLMYYSLNWSYWITLGLAVLNGLFLVRVFIIQHDCGHYAFFKKVKTNDIVGFLCSFLSSVPYKYWARTHQFHHAHNGQLDHISIGDIKTLSTDQYRALTKVQRFRYRLFRNPIVLHIIGPIYYLLVVLRLPLEIKTDECKRLKVSLLMNNLFITLVYTAFAFWLGWDTFLMIQVPILVVFITIAFWFFYVQHQHEQTYKAWKDKWDYLLSAMKGSSYYKLPRVFQWFSGNIGFHHIHHLNPRIPNYKLEQCAKENSIFEEYLTTLTFWQSTRLIFNHLWDEERQQMISFWKFNRLERLNNGN